MFWKRNWGLDFVFALLLVCLPATVFADSRWLAVDGIVGGQIFFDSDTGVIQGAEKRISIAMIPSEIDGVTVTAVADKAFANGHALELVTFPETITWIGQEAFANCPLLTGITLPSSLASLGARVFDGTMITRLELPSSLEVVPSGLVGHMSALRHLVVPVEVSSVESGAVTIHPEQTEMKIFYGGTASAWAEISASDGIWGLMEGTLVFLDSGSVYPEGMSPSVEQDDNVSEFDDFLFDDVEYGENHEEFHYDETVFEESFSSSLEGFVDDTYHSWEDDYWESAYPDWEEDFVMAYPSTARCSVNGNLYENIPAYEIEGETYFRLVDLATLLQDTGARFAVTWNPEWQVIGIETNTAYLADNGEMNPLPEEAMYGKKANISLYKDVEMVDLDTYVVDGRSYYKLDALQELLNFVMRWEASSHTIHLTTGTNTPAYVFSEQIVDLFGGTRLDDSGNLGLVVQFDFVNQHPWVVYPYQEIEVYASQGTWELTSLPHYLPTASITHETLCYENFYEPVAPNEMITLSFAFTLFDTQTPVMIEVGTKTFLSPAASMTLPLRFTSVEMSTQEEYFQILEMFLSAGSVVEEGYWSYQNGYVLDMAAFSGAVKEISELFVTYGDIKVEDRYRESQQNLLVACEEVLWYLPYLELLMGRGAVLSDYDVWGLGLYDYESALAVFSEALNICEDLFVVG